MPFDVRKLASKLIYGCLMSENWLQNCGLGFVSLDVQIRFETSVWNFDLKRFSLLWFKTLTDWFWFLIDAQIRTKWRPNPHCGWPFWSLRFKRLSCAVLCNQFCIYCWWKQSWISENNFRNLIKQLWLNRNSKSI